MYKRSLSGKQLDSDGNNSCQGLFFCCRWLDHRGEEKLFRSEAVVGTPFNKDVGVAKLGGEAVMERWVLDTNSSPQYHIKDGNVLGKVTPERPFGFNAPSDIDTVGVLLWAWPQT
jgi:hypothetical protein